MATSPIFVSMCRAADTRNRLVLVGLNAKYIHSNLALHYLYDVAQKCDTKWHIEKIETTINDIFAVTLRRLVERQGDLYAFSCYIWNIETILKCCEGIKKSLPQAKILLGGPEVSYRAASLLKNNPDIDFVISGEGEVSFERLLLSFGDLTSYQNIPGLIYHSETRIYENLQVQNSDFESVPDIYADNWQSEKWHNRIIYYESSRGCPYQCAYCLSAIDKRVRYKPLTEVKKDIEGFIQAGVPQVKLVDRTFNTDMTRAKQIFRMILNCEGHTNFHFEMTPENFDEEMFEIIASAPKGILQFEIGLQSIHPATLKAIHRKNDLEKVAKHIRRLVSMGHCHIHLDLIAGLPEETMASFVAGFNWTMGLQPHMLQLGFLKVLSGTPLYQQRDDYQLVYNSFTPYEIISNGAMTAQELNALRRVELVLERIYNSGLFATTLYFLKQENILGDFYNFYQKLGDWWVNQNYDTRGVGKRELFLLFYTYLVAHYPFTSNQKKALQEVLAVDLLQSGENKVPAYLEKELIVSHQLFEWLHQSIDAGNVLPPPMEGFKPKELVKKIKVLPLSYETMALVCELNQIAQCGSWLVFFDQNRHVFSMEPNGVLYT